MKTFPRVLQLMSLLLLVTVVSPGGSEVGAARENGSGENESVIPESLPQVSPEILSFTATPQTILRGETAVLNWRVANADHVWISQVERIDSGECIKRATGEMQVKPVAETTYRLHAWRWQSDVVAIQLVTVQVREPSGVCRISGTVSRNRKDYGTTVGLHAAGAPKPMFSTGVDSNGFYEFTSVPEGRYHVILRGKYPPGQEGRFSIGPIPSFQEVLCQPNKSHPANFRIGGREG